MQWVLLPACASSTWKTHALVWGWPLPDGPFHVSMLRPGRLGSGRCRWSRCRPAFFSLSRHARNASAAAAPQRRLSCARCGPCLMRRGFRRVRLPTCRLQTPSPRGNPNEDHRLRTSSEPRGARSSHSRSTAPAPGVAFSPSGSRMANADCAPVSSSTATSRLL
jgi:hypothetical protein